ncbi:MAG TPA: hypothetical protein VF754_09830, partial [Pyrinomonadaceae bacterium]
GVGPILAAGIVGAAILGAGGAAAGMAAGGALEDNVATGLPHDELFVYEDALRRGHTVLIVTAEDDERADAVRAAMTEAGAESIDAARDKWWVGLRDAEEEEYTEQGGDFLTDEQIYRSGFEAALHPSARGATYDEDAARLRECYGAACEEGAFRRGYERGHSYQRALLDKYKG